MKTMVLDVHEKPKAWKWIALSLQHLFAMFGATILVPLLTGLQPAVALLSSGVGTLAYLIITRGKIPAYLGSSFAFIVPIISVSKTEGMGAALFGCFLAGIVYGVVALIITRFGSGWLHQMLPPVVIGSVVIVIGLSLAGTAVDMASTHQITQTLPDNVKDFQSLPGTVESIDEQAGTVTLKVYSLQHFGVALVTLSIAVIASLFLRGFLNLIPVLLGIVGGYLTALAAGMVDFPVREAAWFALPRFTTPEVSWTAALVIIPVALVTLAEHIGHLMVTSGIMNRDLTKGRTAPLLAGRRSGHLHRFPVWWAAQHHLRGKYRGDGYYPHLQHLGDRGGSSDCHRLLLHRKIVCLDLHHSFPSDGRCLHPSLRHHRLRRSADVGGKPDGFR